jgi:hypothetical protein
MLWLAGADHGTSGGAQLQPPLDTHLTRLRRRRFYVPMGREYSSRVIHYFNRRLVYKFLDPHLWFWLFNFESGLFILAEDFRSGEQTAGGHCYSPITVPFLWSVNEYLYIKKEGIVGVGKQTELTSVLFYWISCLCDYPTHVRELL